MQAIRWLHVPYARSYTIWKKFHIHHSDREEALSNIIHTKRDARCNLEIGHYVTSICPTCTIQCSHRAWWIINIANVERWYQAWWNVHTEHGATLTSHYVQHAYHARCTMHISNVNIESVVPGPSPYIRTQTYKNQNRPIYKERISYSVVKIYCRFA